VWSVKCEVWSVKFEVWSAKSAVCSVRCGVSREGHGRDRLSLNYRSFLCLGNFRRRLARVCYVCFLPWPFQSLLLCDLNVMGPNTAMAGQDRCDLQNLWVPPNFISDLAPQISKLCCLNVSNSQRNLTCSSAHQVL